ncbi:MAG: radical SAM protein [Bacteroidota bacterium]
MANILFTHSYFYRFDEKQWAMKQPYPPYGTLYAAAKMREEGHHVALFDTNLVVSPVEIKPILKSEQPDYLVIYDDGFNYLTKMCLTNMREAAFELIKFGKENACKVIVSSSDSTDHPDFYLEKGADFILLGEGEETLSELVTAIESGQQDMSSILGICYHSETFVKNPRRPVIRNLDSLPDPAWDLVDIDMYRKVWMEGNGYFSLNIATTRGCPFKCNWCAKPIYGNRYNSRSPERVANEIEMLVSKFGARHFWFSDDIFGLKPGWVQSFRDIVKAKNLQFSYKIQSRVDLLLQEDTIAALAQSGLKTVWVGAESGSQKILDAMDKGTKIEQIYEATELLKRKGVEVGFFLQFGYLGETREDISSTIQMVLDCMPDDIGISVSYPLPGTKFFEMVKAQLDDKQNWSHSDDLAMMYKGTFSPDFYRRLHRFVHKTFRKHQGFANLKGILMNPTAVNRSKLRSALATVYYIPAAAIDNYKLRLLEKQSVS